MRVIDGAIPESTTQCDQPRLVHRRLRLWVAQVFKDGEAFRSGLIQAGDVLKEVNGVSLAGMPFMVSLPPSLPPSPPPLLPCSLLPFLP